MIVRRHKQIYAEWWRTNLIALNGGIGLYLDINIIMLNSDMYRRSIIILNGGAYTFILDLIMA